MAPTKQRIATAKSSRLRGRQRCSAERRQPRRRLPPSARDVLGQTKGTDDSDKGRTEWGRSPCRRSRPPARAGLLESPEVAHGAAHPGVITALEGQSARQLADHEGCRQAPENGSEQKDEDRAAVSGAVNDVFCAIGSARDHKECCGHQRPQSEANRFFVIGNGGYEDFLTRGASCGQFRWLPPRATHSQQLRAGWALRASGSWIPEIPLELVRSDEITGNSRRCKKNFANFSKDHQPQRSQRNTEELYLSQFLPSTIRFIPSRRCAT